MNNEVKVFGFHFRTENELSKVMTQDVIKTLKKYKAAVCPCKDLSKYFASFVCLQEKDRDACVKELEEQGIKIDKEKQSAFIDKAYIDMLI